MSNRQAGYRFDKNEFTGAMGNLGIILPLS
jgi:hypothetical protein